MFCMTCKAAPVSVAGGDVIPFDTVVCSTNGNVKQNGSAAEIVTPGWYMVSIQAILSATTATTTTIQLCTQGNAVSGAAMTVDVPANGTHSVNIEWPVQVINATSGNASITWANSAEVTVDSATEIIRKAV